MNMPYFLSASSTTIYYEQHGRSGPFLVLVHGLASSGKIWKHQINTLKQSFRLLVLDLPGHGKSDRCQSYSFDGFADWVAELMTYCHIEKASLLGVSLGCSVVLTVAARYPARVTAIVLEGPVAGFYPWWNPLGTIDWIVFLALPLLISSVSLFISRRRISHWVNTFGLKKKRSFKVLETLQELVDLRALRQLLWQSACPTYVKSLRGITCPVLMVRGQNDPMPLRFARLIAKHLQHVKWIEVPDTRHLVAMESPDIFNNLVLGFLSTSNKGVEGHEILQSDSNTR